MAAIKEQVEEQALAVLNKQQQVKGTCQNCARYGLKVVHCPEKKNEEKINDTNKNTKCHLSGMCFFCSKVGKRIIECHSKKAVE